MQTDVGLFVLRLGVGGIVMMHGLLKLGLVGKGGSITGAGGWFDSLGLRPGLFWALTAVVAEAGGGLLTVLGIGGPLGPAIVAADLVVVTIVAHWAQGFWAGGGKVGWEFPAGLFVGATAIALIGNGRWSLDEALRLSYPEWLLPTWSAVMVVGVVLALGARAMFAPTKPA